MAATPFTAALEAELTESEALCWSGPSTTHPAMFDYTGGERDDGDDVDNDDDNDVVIVPSTFVVEVLTAGGGSGDATILGTR
jgi:hypothetical protein